MSSGFLVAIIIAVIVVALVVVMGLIAGRYQKVAPNEVLVIAGRKRTIQTPEGPRTVGHRTVKGGGTFVWPVVEKVSKLSLNAMSLEVSTSDAYTSKGVPVTVDSVVVMKIGGDDVSIANAAERFLDRKPEDIKNIAQEVLSGHLRAICSKLTPEEINKERTKFQQEVLQEAEGDFRNMGLYIDSFTVKQIRDDNGYMEALGKASTANVKRDAIIGEAEALEKEAIQKKTDAQKEGSVRRAENEALIASAERDRDIKKAQYTASVAAERAKAEQAGPKSTAIATQEVVEAQTDLALKTAVRTEKELLASKIKPAEAEKQSVIIHAEAAREQMVLQAEGSRKQQQLEGEGEAARIEVVGRAKGAASAAEGKGEAEGLQAKLIAEAEGKKAGLLAEAEGLFRKAQAMREFNDESRMLQVTLELIHVLPQLVHEAAIPITSVKDIKIMDFGGHNGDGAGAGPIDKVLNISPKTLASVDAVLSNTIGLNLPEVIKLIRSGKLDLSKLEAGVGNADDIVSPAVVRQATSEKKK